MKAPSISPKLVKISGAQILIRCLKEEPIVWHFEESVHLKFVEQTNRGMSMGPVKC